MKKRRKRRRIEGNRCHGPREEPRATQFAFLYNSSLMSSLNHVDDVQQRCRATPCSSGSRRSRLTTASTSRRRAPAVPRLDLSPMTNVFHPGDRSTRLHTAMNTERDSRRMKRVMVSIPNAIEDNRSTSWPSLVQLDFHWLFRRSIKHLTRQICDK